MAQFCWVVCQLRAEAAIARSLGMQRFSTQSKLNQKPLLSLDICLGSFSICFYRGLLVRVWHRFCVPIALQQLFTVSPATSLATISLPDSDLSHPILACRILWTALKPRLQQIIPSEEMGFQEPVLRIDEQNNRIGSALVDLYLLCSYLVLWSIHG